MHDDTTPFTDLLLEEIQEAERIDADEKAKLDHYLRALRTILRLPGREGVTVLRHWLDSSMATTNLSVNNASVHGLTALHDYAQSRLAEIALADPKNYTQILLEGHRQYARENILKKRKRS